MKKTSNDTQKPIESKEEFKVGDTVLFTGNTHYASADAATGKSCKSGKVKIKKIYNLGKSKHPYCVQAISRSDSTAYGWVDEKDIDNIAEFKSYRIKTIKKSTDVKDSPATKANTVTTLGKNEVYTIVEEKNGFGLLKSKAGWIDLSKVNRM
jgi:hypothetical protein